MKILHLCLSNFYIEGYGYQENIIPKYNKKHGHDVSIIASRFTYNNYNGKAELTNAGEYVNENGIKVIRVDYKYPWLGKINEKLKIYKETYSLIEKEEPDLIFCHGIQFLDLSVVAKYIENNPTCRLVADNHAAKINSATNFLSREILHKRIYKKVIHKSVSQISKFFMIAPGCKDFAIEMYDLPEDRMEYLYLGADVDMIRFDKKTEIKTEIRSKLNIDNSDFVYITGGKLGVGKNIKALIQSFKNIQLEKVKLVIFGAFSEEIRDEMISLIALDSRIKYIGWLPSEDVYDYYLASDAGIFPGSKSALWEQAICSGLPIICRRWPGMKYVDVGGNVLFVENDINEIADRIEYLATRKDVYNQMKRVACTKGIEMFSYDIISKRAVSIE